MFIFYCINIIFYMMYKNDMLYFCYVYSIHKVILQNYQNYKYSCAFLPYNFIPGKLVLYSCANLDTYKFNHGSVLSSVTQSCPTLCDPMNCSTPGLSVHHQLPEFTQTHFHRVGDAIQPFHPLLSPAPPAPNPSKLQSLFQ